jgi:iron complex outermembrane receptor protein
MKSFSFPAVLALVVTGVQAETPVVLDPVEVTAQKQSLTVPSLDAARAELARTPGGTETVDADRYLTGRASTLADTFFLSPGVVAQSRFGSDEARLSIRGSGLQRTFHGRGIRVLQDGVPINLADGGFDMQSLEPTATAYINVWRGGNALAYGSSTLGGAIDYISRNGRTSPGGFARLEVGSWDYLRATIAGGTAHENTDAYASFTQQQQDGFRDHAEQNNQRLFTNAGWRLSDTVETRLYLTAIKTDSELPGSLTKAELEDNPRQQNSVPATQAGDQKRDFELVRVASKTTFAASPDTTWNLVAAWSYKDLDHPIFQVIDQVSNDALVGLTLNNNTDFLSREHSLRAGVLFNRGQTDSANFVNVGGSQGALVSRDDQTATNLEAFAESQLSLGGGFTSVLGFSASHNRRDTTRTFGAVNPSNTYDRTYDELAPKIGVRWDNAARDTQVYANVSGSYEPPSFSESGTAVVANKAQSATTFELGTRGERSFVRWDASVYHARIKDELLAIVLPGGATGTLNADRTIHQGAEVGFAADVLGQAWKDEVEHRLVLRAAWTYGDFRFDGATPGVAGSNDNRIAGVAPHLVRGEFLFELKSGWYVGPTFEWVPVKSYVDHANTLSADPYALLGFKFGRRVDKGLSWFVEAKNLTDETYAATTGVVLDSRIVPMFPGADPLANQRQFLPGDGRSVFAGIEYRF